jgi:hypothetical protein
MIFGLREQDVNVIAHGINLNQRRIVVLEDAGDVGVKLAALLVTQELATALRREHEMDDDVGERLGHGGGVLSGVLAGCKSAM